MPITIQSVQVTGSSGGTVTQVTVSGHADVPCGGIEVTVDCVDANSTVTGTVSGIAYVTNQQWSLALSLACPCKGGCQFRVTAVCSNGSDAGDTWEGPVECPQGDCCPTLELTATVFEPCIAGEKKVTFVLKATRPAGCSQPIICWVDIDPGTGPSGRAVVSLSPTTTTGSNTDSVSLPPGLHNLVATVILPTGCQSHTLQVDVTACDETACCPDIQVTISEEFACNPDTGLFEGEFTLTANVPAGCPVATIQLAFGDGTFSQMHNVPAGTTTLTFAHAYANNQSHQPTVLVAQTACQPAVPPTVGPFKACPKCECPVLGAIAGPSGTNPCLASGSLLNLSLALQDPDDCIQDIVWAFVRIQPCAAACGQTNMTVQEATQTPNLSTALDGRFAPGDWMAIATAPMSKACCKHCGAVLVSQAYFFSIAPASCPTLSGIARSPSYGPSGRTYDFTAVLQGNWAGSELTWDFGDGTTQTQCVCGPDLPMVTHEYDCDAEPDQVTVQASLDPNNHCCQTSMQSLQVELDKKGCCDTSSWCCRLAALWISALVAGVLHLALAHVFANTGQYTEAIMLGTGVALLSTALVLFVIWKVFCKYEACCICCILAWLWVILGIAGLVGMWVLAHKDLKQYFEAGIIVTIVALVLLVIWLLLCKPSRCARLWNFALVLSYAIGIIGILVIFGGWQDWVVFTLFGVNLTMAGLLLAAYIFLDGLAWSALILDHCLPPKKWPNWIKPRC